METAACILYIRAELTTVIGVVLFVATVRN
jgi:hypothetical protein